MPGLAQTNRALRSHFGPPTAPPAEGTWELILYENCAYLVDDKRRDKVWAALKKQVRLDPPRLLSTDIDRLAGVILDGGMQPERRAEKLHECARLAIEACEGDVDAVVNRPPREARKLLKLFPGVGDPGADKLMMCAGRQQVLALESNGLRVLLRLGYGEENKNYSRSYASVQSAIASELPKSTDDLIQAHLLLRQHGRVVCRQSKPACSQCPLASDCPSVKN